ncbi:uncharacterized protein LOC127254161 isoform X2 [Andrographis paniculata]|nr:uncharacterized protein LOC127254161 isoform X2 [Andrographis paniculata]
MARSSAYPAAAYSPLEESSGNRVVASTIENTMKKYTDSVMRFLEGISLRLSQLELYCYNLDKSIGEMRSDLVSVHAKSESKLKLLEIHIEEVHRSIQILRDKQELADTQKELSKLHLAQKESSSTGNSQQSDDRDRAATPTSERRDSNNSSDSHNQQLALIVSHHVSPQPSRHTQPQQPLDHHQQPHLASLPPSMPAYYLTTPQMMNTGGGVTQPSQPQYLKPLPHVQDHSRMPAPSVHYHVNPSSHPQPVSAFLPQWSQQPPQQPVMQPKIRNPSQVVCSGYMTNQSNPPTPETASNTMPVQVPFPGPPQPGFTSHEATSHGYGAGGRPIQQQPSMQHIKTAFSTAQPQPGNSYSHSGPRPALHSGNTYLIYEGEGGRPPHHPPAQVHFQQSNFPSNAVQPQRPQQVSNMVAPHMARSHPYSELIEKLAGMGYRSDHVINIIQRLEESGQAIDFNAVLDRLNAHSAEGSQRGWSG